MTYKLKAAISLASNSPGASTGYGVQAELLTNKLLEHGAKVAALSNYGLEGRFDTIKTKHGEIAHYPRGHSLYSEDVMGLWAKDFASKHPELKPFLLTLYDVWVLNNLKYDGEIISWVPLDHITLPPEVAKFLLRSNVTPITMSPHGQRQLEENGIDSVYIPHAVDTKVFKPTHEFKGKPIREFLQIPEDAFLVTMVQANKANGLVHRKALAEQFLAFALFKQEHPNSFLYLHSEPSKVYGGFDFGRLLKAVGLDQSSVLIADSDQLRVGYPQEFLAAIYTTTDVLLSCSYGEGFGVPVVEAQACGTRVITSGFAATQDLAAEDSWVVGGQPFWDEPQGAFFQIPFVNSIIGALKLAYEAPRGTSQTAIDFAKQFDVEEVWNNYWLPFWKERLAK
jgi:glycosyltransferase involved in cell wall biosynthesis